MVVAGLKDNLEVLHRVPMFSGVDSGCLRLLAYSSMRRRFAPGETLVKQGDMTTDAYLIVEGVVDVVVDGVDGPVKVGTFGPNDVVGEISLLTRRPRSATLVAVTDVDTILIEKAQLLDIIEHSPHMALSLLRVFADRLATATAALAKARSV